MDSYYPDKRKRAENEANLDMAKPIQQLLADVHDESLDEKQQDAQRLGRVMARFASLLARLSKDAEISTRRIVRLTLALLIFTAALLAVAIIQTKIMFKQDANAHAHQIQAGQNQEAVSTNK
jgi:hypothetical protein